MPTRIAMSCSDTPLAAFEEAGWRANKLPISPMLSSSTPALAAVGAVARGHWSVIPKPCPDEGSGEDAHNRAVFLVFSTGSAQGSSLGLTHRVVVRTGTSLLGTERWCRGHSRWTVHTAR